MNKIKKISAAITAAAILAVAVPVTGVLPDVMSVTAFAGGEEPFREGYEWIDENDYHYEFVEIGNDEYGARFCGIDKPTAIITSTFTIPSEIRVTGNIMGKEIDGEMVLKVTQISYDYRVGENFISLTIPDSVTSTGQFFKNSSNLESVTYEGKTYSREQFPDLYDYINYGECDANGLWIKNGVLTKAEPNIGAVVTIPNGVTRIKHTVFEGFTNLTSVTIPNSVTEIGIWAFKGCTSLKSITIPGSVTEICEGAFEGCTNLAEVTIKDGVTKISGGAKYDPLVGAFYRCTSLKSITIPNSVTEIGYQAFAGCESLTNVTIHGKVTEIGEAAFAGCTNLKSVTISDGVNDIGEWAFANCPNLTNVTIPRSVSEISWGAFSDCKSLTNVYYVGSKEDWEKIDICTEFEGYDGSKDLLNANIHFNSTGPSNTPVTPTPITPNPVTPNPVKPNPEKVVYNASTDILGDVDGDGKSTARDATAILKYAVGLAVFDGNSMQNALVTGGEKPSARDATQILKMAVGLA
ncbi:MAG: leucine-rich repeat protein [Oscillospiraceae bacterium]|nr:leucine-rich repeat protein [Oscillospiraceae bacterium]